MNKKLGWSIFHLSVLWIGLMSCLGIIFMVDGYLMEGILLLILFSMVFYFQAKETFKLFVVHRVTKMMTQGLE